MMGALKSILVTLMVLVFLCSKTLEAQQQKSENNAPVAHAITASVQLKSPVTVNWQGIAELGVLDSGKKYRLELEIENCTKEDISFEGVRPNCACNKFVVKERFLARQGKIIAVAEFTAVAGSESGKYGFSINFHANQKEIGMIVANYAIAGGVYIDQNKNVFNVGKDMSVVDIPVYFTPPVTLKTLSITGIESFSNADIQAELVGTNESNAVIRITAHPKFIEGEETSGTIKLHESLNETCIPIPLLINKVPALSISPKILRFQEVDGEADLVQANVLIRINENQISPEKKLFGGVRATVDDFVIETKVKSLSGQIFRINLVCNKAALKEVDLNDVTWAVVVNGKKHVSKTNFLVRE